MGNFSKSSIVINSISLYLFLYNIYEVQSNKDTCIKAINKSLYNCKTPIECLRKYQNRSVKPHIIPDEDKTRIALFLKNQPFYEKYGYYLSIYVTYGHIKKPIIFCRLLYPSLIEKPNNREDISIPTTVRATDGEIIYQLNNQMRNTVVDQMRFITPEEIEKVSDITVKEADKLRVLRNDNPISFDERYEKLVKLRKKCHTDLKGKKIIDTMTQRNIFLSIYRKSNHSQAAKGLIANAFIAHVLNEAILSEGVKNPEEYCENINIINDAIISTWDDHLNIPCSNGITSYLNSFLGNNNNVHRDVIVNNSPLNTDINAENTIPFNTTNYYFNDIPSNTSNYTENTTDTSTRTTINLMSSLEQEKLPDFRIMNPEDKDSLASSSNNDWLSLWNK